MPNGDFLNPRYYQENQGLSSRQLKKKYGYVPKVNSEDYDCESDYLSALREAQKAEEEDWNSYE